jgi:cysteine desulfurase
MAMVTAVRGNAVIYLDNNASTAPDPAVVEAVTAAMSDFYANASSQHAPGRRAAAAVERAREQVAALANSTARSVIFTSGATEADALAIRGLWDGAQAAGLSRDTVVVGATEHAAVIEAARSLERRGARVLLAPVHPDGVVDIAALRELVDERVLLVSIMAANSETGTLAPLDAVVSIARDAGAFVHSDATQLIGRLPLSMTDLDVDMISLSGHKMHGPKGVGALLAGRHVHLTSQIYGGGQERGLRSGTSNTPGIVGFGVAAELAVTRLGEVTSITSLRDRLHQGIIQRFPDATLNGNPLRRLPNTLNLRFPGADAEAVLASLQTVICSAGSACHAGAPEPSHVLLAMGLDHEAAYECLRFSLSRLTSAQEIDSAVEEIVAAVRFVRHAELVEVG